MLPERKLNFDPCYMNFYSILFLLKINEVDIPVKTKTPSYRTNPTLRSLRLTPAVSISAEFPLLRDYAGLEIKGYRDQAVPLNSPAAFSKF